MSVICLVWFWLVRLFLYFALHAHARVYSCILIFLLACLKFMCLDPSSATNSGSKRKRNKSAVKKQSPTDTYKKLLRNTSTPIPAVAAPAPAAVTPAPAVVAGAGATNLSGSKHRTRIGILVELNNVHIKIPIASCVFNHSNRSQLLYYSPLTCRNTSRGTYAGTCGH